MDTSKDSSRLSKRSTGLSRRLCIGLLCGWLLLAGGGFALLADYTHRPGIRKDGVPVWPYESSIPKSEGQSSLVVFIHPKCPCTRATLRELGHVLQRENPNALLQFVVYRPADAPSGWENTAMVKRCRDFPRSDVLIDSGGKEWGRFGATTSGHAMLYSAAGRLLFSGGITMSRNHEGRNIARDALTRAIHHGQVSDVQFPVFGCPVSDQSVNGQRGALSG